MKKIFSVSMLLVCSAATYGSLLFSENFADYTLGSLNDQNGWKAVSGVNVVDGGLSYSKGNIQINGGNRHAVWSGVNNLNAASKGFTNTDHTGDIWFSFTMQVDATNSSNRFWFYVSGQEGLQGNPGMGVVGQIANSSTAFNSGYRVNTTQFASSPVTMPTGTAFIVGKLSKTGAAGYDQMEMWINPDSVLLSGGIVAHNTSGFNVTISTFGIATSGTGSTVQWGNLLIGTDQASVLDVYANIPEPATFAFAAGALALAGVCFKRRFNKKG